MNILVCGAGGVARIKHGCAPANGRHPLYYVWSGMQKRCYNPNVKDYSRYGALGIIICEEWRNSPLQFIEWSLAHGWKPGLQIDRINNIGPYSPENCRFTTGKINCRNRRNNRLITAFGETKVLAEWAEDARAKANRAVIRQRLDYYGWTPERAIATSHTAWRNRGKKKEKTCAV